MPGRVSNTRRYLLLYAIIALALALGWSLLQPHLAPNRNQPPGQAMTLQADCHPLETRCQARAAGVSVELGPVDAGALRLTVAQLPAHAELRARVVEGTADAPQVTPLGLSGRGPWILQSLPAGATLRVLLYQGPDIWRADFPLQ